LLLATMFIFSNRPS